MLQKFKLTKTTFPKTGMVLNPDMDVCQTDYPLDWYQEEFIPYAEEYLALPDRKPKTIINWMKKYVNPAIDYFGDKLLLLAHYYMGGEIVKLVEIFGGQVGDSYQLALMAMRHPEKKLIVESAVHFMAETISILANPDQRVFITNPKAGCTMELNAKDYMVEPALNDLVERYGRNNILPICYVNTSGRIKALTGEFGGATCTSSNVKKIFEWALKQNKKILFIPDQHMGENVAGWLDIPSEKIAYWPGGEEGANYDLFRQDEKTLKRFDESQLVLFCSFCGVHTYFEPEMVDYWHEKKFTVLVHPECKKVTADRADGAGSTAYLWQKVINDEFKTKHYAVGTENHMVQNLKEAAAAKGITVVNLADALFPDGGSQGENRDSPPGSPSANLLRAGDKLKERVSQKLVKGLGCGCATMSRNDPPHLVATLDLLRQGRAPDYNEVKAGDVIADFSGTRLRLDEAGQKWVIENARIALENMIKITES